MSKLRPHARGERDAGEDDRDWASFPANHALSSRSARACHRSCPGGMQVTPRPLRGHETRTPRGLEGKVARPRRTAHASTRPADRAADCRAPRPARPAAPGRSRLRLDLDPPPRRLCAAISRVFRGQDAIPFRQRSALFRDRSPVRLRIPARGPLPPAERAHPREVDDLRVRRKAPVGPAWFNFNPRFYIVALVYVVFDVEIAFMYPVATVFKSLGRQGAGHVRASVEIFVFVAILMLGLVYVWAKGDLEWVKGLEAGSVQSRATRSRKPDSACRTSRGEGSVKRWPRKDYEKDFARDHHQRRPVHRLDASTSRARAASGTCSSASPAAASS